MNSRRRFIRGISYTGVAVLVGAQARAADAPMVSESDPTAVQLGYVADATKANKAKYPNYKPGQDCATCQLYQGKPGSAAGPCPLYPGKRVAAKGWCSAFVKKA